MTYSGVYKIVNITTNINYIGSAINLERRLYMHKYQLKNSKHHNTYLQEAWDKYGEKDFIFVILIICEKENLLDYEQKVMKTYNSLFNICKIAGSSLGVSCRTDVKKKISDSLKEYYVNNAHPMIGRAHSEESKKKMSLSKKEYFTTEKGEELKSIIAKSNKRRECPEFAKKRTEAIQKFFSDPIRSKATREKMSEALRKRHKELRRK